MTISAALLKNAEPSVGTEFRATDNQKPILTINAPIGLNFRDDPGDIVNRSDLKETEIIDEGTESESTRVNRIGLKVDQGQNITLIGGNVLIENSGLTAPGGRVDLGGLSAAGTVTFNEDGSLNFPEDVPQADINLTNAFNVDVSGTDGGNISINARNLILNANRDAEELGSNSIKAGITADSTSANAKTGDITINVTDNLTINNSSIESRTLGRGDAGDIEINATNRISLDDSNIKSEVDENRRNNEAIGNAGNITLTTRELNLENNSRVSSQSFAVGDAGDITINSSERVILDDDSKINSNLNDLKDGIFRAMGDGGNIKITTQELILDNSSEFDASSSGIGKAGNITIDAPSSVTVLDGGQIQSQVRGDNGEGNAGDITINTGSFSLKDRSLIQSDNKSKGNAGNITINATDSVVLDGLNQIDPDKSFSLIISQVQENVEGQGGNINISAPSISLANFSLVSTNAKQGSSPQLGSRGAGNVTLEADTITVTTGSIIDALTETDFDGGDIQISANVLKLNNGGKIVAGNDAGGNAGNINLNIAGDIILNNGNPPENFFFSEQILQDLEFKTGIFANNFPGSTGDGGNIDITADSINFEDNGSISAKTVSGEGGNVTLRVNDNISMRNNSLISAKAGGTGDGGNIEIDTTFIIAQPNQNSDILASAGRQGGRITIDAEGIFAIEVRPPDRVTNDIDASGGVEQGQVIINNPDVDITRGLTETPQNVVQPEQTVTQACQSTNVADEPSGLTIKGKGGIPPEPTEPFMADALIPDGKPITIDKETDLTSLLVEESESEQLDPHYIPPHIKPIETSMGDIYPARGIIKTEDGEIILTVYPTDNVNTRTPHNSANCSLLKDEEQETVNSL